MNELITKKTLEQSLNFFSEINLNEEDYKNVLSKFEMFFENSDNKLLIEKIINTIPLNEQKDLKSILKGIINSKEIPHLNILLQRMIKSENLINEIQDYFIEKLI